MFFLSKAVNKIGGSIAYFNLQDWWLQEFTEAERREIEDTYKPMGSADDRPLTQGKIDWSSGTDMMLLSSLAGWFNNRRQRNLANRIITKAEELASKNMSNVLDVHFLYSEIIAIYYPQRDDISMFGKAIEACNKQIEMAPEAARAFQREYPNESLPGHVGYEQLVIILHKQKQYKEAIALCELAKKQGWSGEWDKRVERYKKLMSK